MRILRRLFIILVAALVVVGATAALSQTTLATALPGARFDAGPEARQRFNPAQTGTQEQAQTGMAINAPARIRGRGGLDGAGALFSVTPLVRNLGIMSAIVLGFVLLNVAYRTTRTRLTPRHKPE